MLKSLVSTNFYISLPLHFFFSPAPIIQTHPSSLLVPLGYEAVFECTIQHCPSTCEVHWLINNNSTAYPNEQQQFEDHSFVFSNKHDTDNKIFKGRLSVSSSVAVNNTHVCCLIQDGINSSKKTAQAILLALSGTLDTILLFFGEFSLK